MKIIIGLAIQIPGECVPRFTGVENRINQKNDGTNNYPDCTGIWNTNDFINYSVLDKIILDSNNNLIKIRDNIFNGRQ